MFFSTRYAPVRSDLDIEALSAAQRNALTLINEADELVLSFEFAMPAQMRSSMDIGFRAFVGKPEDIESIISKFEENRQRMVDQGVLLTE